MRWLDSITDSMYMNLCKLQETVKDRGDWHALVHAVAELDTTEQLSNNNNNAAKSLQSCPTLWHPIDSSPLVSAVPGILQARTLEWVAISFPIVWKWKVKVKLISRVLLIATPWTAAYQAPPPMGFSSQEYWSGLPLPSPTTIMHYSKLIHILIND